MSDFSEAQLAADIDFIRAALTATTSDPIITQQIASQRGPKFLGRCWVSRVTFPAPTEASVSSLLAAVIEHLGDGGEAYTMPLLEPVEAHWTGFRSGVSAREPEPPIPEVDKYAGLMKEVTSPITILYAYGGGHTLNSPATRYLTAAMLSQLTGGRCLIVRHRSAPQNPFPAAIIDVMISYLSLLYPSEGSLHEPVSASNIVFAADSSGSALLLPVIQIILSARSQQKSSEPTIYFNGKRVLLPMPAGVALQSPYLDIGDTLPSWAANWPYDIYPAQLETSQTNPRFPADAAWPANPARGLFYCETSMLSHPLVSPILSKSWRGSPPIYIAVGSKERIVDGAKLLAQQAAREGTKVLWDEYELMPHSWPMVLPRYPQATACISAWANACMDFVAGVGKNGEGSKGQFRCFKGMSIQDIDVTAMTPLTVDYARTVMRMRQAAIRPWTGNTKATKANL